MIKLAPNPFTPQSGLEPKVLGGRENLMLEFVHLLEQKARGEEFHLLLLGEWGMGKTTLLKFYKKMAQSKGWPAVYVSVPKISSRENSHDVIQSLAEEICFGIGLEPEQLIRFKRKNISIFVVEFLSALYELLQKELILVLIDDLQNVSVLPQVVDILRLALSHERILKNTNYLFVLSSTPEGWEGFIRRHDPVGRFFRKKQILNKLSYPEVERTIKETIKDSGISFKEEIIVRVWEYTEGHPYELQLLCSHLYDNHIRRIVAEASWEPALVATLKDLGIEHFSQLYARASAREREVLNILAEVKQFMTISEVRDILIYEKRLKKFPVANVKNFIYRLADKGLLIRDENKRYRILDNMFAEYIVRFRE
jgi:hypothetical protein